jgi:hypothetical protein
LDHAKYRLGCFVSIPLQGLDWEGMVKINIVACGIITWSAEPVTKGYKYCRWNEEKPEA